MKKVETPMLEEVDQNNQEADQIKKDCRIRRSATKKSLESLYVMLEEEISAEIQEKQLTVESPKA